LELIQFVERQGKVGSLFDQEPHWDDHFQQSGKVMDDLTGESLPPAEGVVLSPEGFFRLKAGMRVRHPKFGDGRVRSVEGMDEDQKATILFQTVGSKRLKVRYANLEILE
jgi:hypothetical protein